ncbi:hypothetical protein SMACR_09564 [Sordaria macrospora]|uniref:WGS project CABT00000000 data, contig 2.124 n=2 Tax=Sordaria macrospora TaxID=5147 RepID=F7WCE2_SORMK|nr:uncharacterized protein SMAC_09564 [Sordaria macrospora k-hell]KAA8623968.1 hypothetical protein SMACR_09564 [Sordaria macrospora]KAH7628900.1 hypothetical protein B0T09DRAFT_367226 [Sordaria sp. MPI-SDFR-AT-0083]WPJ57209.1 hypothetical protein SMAC4_09564 [Sordaria macrospora]CCC05603.1 unnamed protein product [Sordaria macrospora k-hell]
MQPQLFQYLFLSTILGLSAASVVKVPGPHDQRAISDDLSSSTHTLPTESGYEPTSTSDISSQGGGGGGGGQGQQPDDGRPTHDPLPISPPTGHKTNMGAAVGYSLLGLAAVAVVIGFCLGLRWRRKLRRRAREEYEMSRRMRRGYRPRVRFAA